MTKVTIKPFYYTCGDWCCTDFWYELYMNEKFVEKCDEYSMLFHLLDYFKEIYKDLSYSINWIEDNSNYEEDTELVDIKTTKWNIRIIIQDIYSEKWFKNSIMNICNFVWKVYNEKFEFDITY